VTTLSLLSNIRLLYFIPLETRVERNHDYYVRRKTQDVICRLEYHLSFAAEHEPVVIRRGEDQLSPTLENGSVITMLTDSTENEKTNRTEHQPRKTYGVTRITKTWN
jgi:hypothetical protein